MQWIKFSERKPEPGQLVAINFKAEWWNLRLCYFDNRASWEAREDDNLGEQPGEWFTERDDKGDWWEPQFVAHWAPIELPPSEGSVK